MICVKTPDHSQTSVVDRLRNQDPVLSRLIVANKAIRLCEDIYAMRAPSIRNPRTFWDVFVVLCLYVLVEYIVLQLTGSFLIQQELVVVAIVFFFWAVWAMYRIFARSSPSR